MRGGLPFSVEILKFRPEVIGSYGRSKIQVETKIGIVHLAEITKVIGLTAKHPETHYLNCKVFKTFNAEDGT